MQNKIFAGTLALVAAASLAACTTKPVVVNTPGPGATVLQVPVPATPNLVLTNRVEASLRSALGTNAAGITVRVEQGTVYLNGNVATQQLHDQAVAAARGTADVRTVVHTGLVISN